MSINFDSSATSNATATSLTFAHTCASSGGTGILWVSVFLGTDASSNKISGVTYNGVAMTNTNTPSGDGASSLYLFYLVNPSSGTNNVVITRSDSFLIIGNSASYIGAKQSSIPDAIVANNGSNGGSPLNIPLTTVADNCWMILTAFDASATLTITLNGTARQGSATTRIFADTNSNQTPAGAKTIQVSQSAGQTIYWIVASFPPFVLIGSDVSGTAVEGFSMTTAATVTGSDVSGVAVENGRVRYGFNNPSKNTSTWNNPSKS